MKAGQKTYLILCLALLCLWMPPRSLRAEEPPRNTGPETAGPGAENPENNPDENNPEQPSEQTNPTNPREFEQYRTSREKRNQSFKTLYTQEADRRFRFILELISEKKYDSATDRLEEFLVLYPDHSMTPRARRELADLRQKTGATEAALYRYRQSAALDRPQQGEAKSLLEMARIKIRQGRFQEARTMLQDIQTRCSGTNEAREAELLEKSYRFIEPPQREPGRGGPRSTSEGTDSASGDGELQDTGKPLFPMDRENAPAATESDTGIDRADGESSTGQRALDRMGEGIERLDSADPLEPLEPMDGDSKKSP